MTWRALLGWVCEGVYHCLGGGVMREGELTFLFVKSGMTLGEGTEGEIKSFFGPFSILRHMNNPSIISFSFPTM